MNDYFKRAVVSQLLLDFCVCMSARSCNSISVRVLSVHLFVLTVYNPVLLTNTSSHLALTL